MKNQTFIYQDLGIMKYQQAWDYQTLLFDRIIEQKIANRQADKPQPTPNYVLFCQHPHVYTLGKSGNSDNLLLDSAKLAQIDAQFFPINRGGDITYHGLGQLVVYPIIDLDNFFTDIHRYMRNLEEVVIRTLADYGISAGRLAGLTGVWLDEPPRKMCAMGVKTSRWVTMHGLALNANTDLSYFDYIVPCGIQDKGVSSMQKELGKTIDLEQVQTIFKKHWENVFCEVEATIV